MNRIHKAIEESLIEQLEGWGFDMDSLRESEGASFSSLDRRSPRAFSTNVSNDPPTVQEVPAEEWCYYAGMPSPSAYMDKS
jgi:hypothetical protein